MSGCVMLFIAFPVLFSVVRVCALENLALNKPTWQEHPWPDPNRDFGSENAVDGKYNDRGTGGQCIINEGGYYTAEWRVDLGRVFNISYINIYYRTDNLINTEYYAKHMAGFSLYVSNTTSKDQGYLCYKDNSRGNLSVDTLISCSIYGRYVIYYNERSPNNNPSYLSQYAYNELCELQVYGSGECCRSPCPKNCLNGECDAYTGQCRSCLSGYYGQFCKNECPPGHYGNECSSQCSLNCYVTRSCDKSSGQCEGGCKLGWTGHTCDQMCDSGYYGEDCRQQCSINCNVTTQCNKVTGQCESGCKPGWKGSTCNQICKPGYYGKNCSNQCSANCDMVSICDKVTGECYRGCKTGWTGIHCDQECNNGYYGPECRNKCGYCLESKHCHHINGSCSNGCLHGYRGDLCNETCPSGLFGLDCINRCDTYCTGNKSCDPVMGICNQGCKKGWSGLMCGSDIFSNRQPYRDNKPIVIGIVLAVVIVLIGSVINFIYWRKKTVINAHTRHKNYDRKADEKEKPENTSKQYTELGKVNKSGNYDELHNYSVICVE